ncbi:MULTISPECIES: ClpXP protease specificity-enhancing factor [unclassified Legionella]|uniref:ClpXP protease specificity-enhancing factor n=1 Tax=unclassified Legionella TaxID=2622702 RepID=UPI0010550C3A|nr:MULTISPECIES: ClpXP protease specificity-enhancing factor [unclassified Legionella]MDI9818426.1 ClpXP protease specificity-enhancing factor [Legionella sp. PL877]
MNMTSNKPYLIRAIYDWIVDNDLTPYVLVNADYPGVQVPQQHIAAGRIILNISPKACRGLHLENDRIVFTARFSGQSHQIFIAPQAVLAIYAKENGQGMEFGEDGHAEPPLPSKSEKETKGRKPALTLVKKDKE